MGASEAHGRAAGAEEAKARQEAEEQSADGRAMIYLILLPLSPSGLPSKDYRSCRNGLCHAISLVHHSGLIQQ